jgi:hypothetical protein
LSIGKTEYFIVARFAPVVHYQLDFAIRQVVDSIFVMVAMPLCKIFWVERNIERLPTMAA